MTVTISTPSPCEIRMVRTFAAPRARVFAALTEPTLLKNWYGAKGWWLTDAEIDLRVGGAWRFVSAGPGGATMASGGVYREIVPPSRLVYTERFDDQWYAGESLVTAELTGATTLTTTLLFETREIRDHVLRSPMERGLGESYARLDTQLCRKDRTMKWTLEVVIVPVSDLDRAKAFYAEQLGFVVDHDTKIDAANRIVQLTPPGSGCSVVIGEGLVPPMPPGSIKGLQLVVPDVHEARKFLLGNGVEVSEVQVLGPLGTGPGGLDNVGFVHFSDPDGNGWAVQQISSRA